MQFKRSVDKRIVEALNETLRNSGMNISAVAVHLRGSDSELAELMPIFSFRTFGILLGGEHKLSVSFTKVNIVNLFLTPRILCIIDDHFILSTLGQMKSD